MSLNEARRLARAASMSGRFLTVRIVTDPAACYLHNPNAHPWCGKETVVVTWNVPGGAVAAGYVWSRQDITRERTAA